MSNNKLIQRCKRCDEYYCVNCSTHSGFEDYCSVECEKKEQKGGMKKMKCNKCNKKGAYIRLKSGEVCCRWCGQIEKREDEKNNNHPSTAERGDGRDF